MMSSGNPFTREPTLKSGVRNSENKLKCGERKLVLNEINDAVSLLLQSTGDSFTAISIFVGTLIRFDGI